MSAEPLPEPGPDLARRVLAERLHWPQGALAECERLERAHPGWSVSWLAANSYPGFERAACYWAVRDSGSSKRMEILSTDPGLLTDAIETAPPPWDWHLRQVIPPRT